MYVEGGDMSGRKKFAVVGDLVIVSGRGGRTTLLGVARRQG